MSTTRFDQLRADCQAFHLQHPQVWELFVKFTFDRIGRGFSHYSAYAIFERIRWETDEAKTDQVHEFKLNNNYRPFYSRRFAAMYPDHKDFFRKRRQTSKDTPATGLNQLRPIDYDDDPDSSAEDFSPTNGDRP